MVDGVMSDALSAFVVVMVTGPAAVPISAAWA